jgi:hypothetical protein
MIRVAILVLLAVAVAGQRVQLADVNAITFHLGRMTTSRRVDPVPQLTCLGEHCNAHTPDTVQCRNAGTGYDLSDVSWECEAEMDDGYRLYDATVGCEGYEDSADPFVLIGSCAVEFRIRATHQTPVTHRTHSPVPPPVLRSGIHRLGNSAPPPRSNGTNPFIAIMMLMAMLFAACTLYCCVNGSEVDLGQRRIVRRRMAQTRRKTPPPTYAPSAPPPPNYPPPRYAPDSPAPDSDLLAPIAGLAAGALMATALSSRKWSRSSASSEPGPKTTGTSRVRFHASTKNR